MKPFEMVPGWRIVPSDREFTLEYLQRPRSARSKPSWRSAGHFGRIEYAVEAYVSEAVRRSGKELPEALVELQAQVESIMTRIRSSPETGNPA